MTITSSGGYLLPTDAYHADPCPQPSLSSSIAKLLVTRTPRHAWWEHPRLNPAYEPSHSTIFDIGNACHSLMLNDPKIFAIIDAENWTTKAAKAARDEAREAGKIPLLAVQWDRVNKMLEAARAQLDAHIEASAAFTDGTPEHTLIWQEGESWCRARLDWHPHTGSAFYDYKTADSADPDAFQRAMISYGYDIQAAFYMRGIKALGLSKNPQFRFVVQETDPPYALSVIAPTPQMLDLAERKVARAIHLWQRCLSTNTWPGYPQRVCYVDAPAYHEAAYMQREERESNDV